MTLKEDNAIIRQIAQRASELYRQYGVKVKPEFITIELRFVHEEIFRLRLADLLAADDANFAHDIGGIHAHIDFRHARLIDCFVPRYAQQ